jgi:hypothetical protein
MVKHHKSEALEEKCKCNECEHKFECFTQERIFTDPIFQGLFEALIAKGLDRIAAIDAVANEIKARMTPQLVYNVKWNDTYGSDTYKQPQIPNNIQIPPIWGGTISSSGGVNSAGTYDYNNLTIDGNNVTYTMTNGEKVNFNVYKCCDTIR